MAEINQEETQQELFLEFAGEAKKRERFIPQSKVNKPILLNTSIEQIILVGIALILLCCFVFFLGVLRGKSLESNPVLPTLQRRTIVSPAKIVPMQAPVNPEVRAANSSVPAKSPEGLNASKPYTIQLSTYRKQDLAEKEVFAFRRSGYYSVIIPSDGYYQVCVGQYATKEDAKKDLKILSARYKGCFLRRR